MSYAITGASGQLGRLAAARLLDQVDPSEVVLLSRTPASLQEFAARGATVRAADFTDPASLRDAFAGVRRLLLISTDTVGSRVAAQRAAIDAAKSAGVERIAYTSVPRPDADNPALVIPDHAATEADLRASGLEWTMLRNNIYADMQPPTLQQAAASGQLITNVGDGRTAYVTRADCAAAAVGALLQDDAANQAYDITGPEALGSADLAELAATIAGGPVSVVDVDDDGFTAGLTAAGLPAEVAQVIASFGAAARGGYLADVTGAVRALGGVEPTPLRALLA